VGEPAGRLVLLSTTHRIAAGLLSWPAWSTLQAADAILVRDLSHPLVPALRAAGLEPEPVTATDERSLAAELLAGARARAVVFLAGADGEAALGDELVGALVPLAERGQAPQVEVLPGSWDVPGARLLDLVAVMDRLRSPGGCPWDAKQTHQSLVHYLLEEAYETVEAVEDGDRAALREELGDLLLQVVFHARVAQEDPEEPFGIDDVAGGIVAKLVSRHPHVFAAVDVDGIEAVEASWEVLKAAEKGRTSALDGVPLAQPALALAAALLARAERAGWSAPIPAPGAVAVAVPAAAEPLGDVLLAMVAGARANGLDAEGALRAAARRYADRVRALEQAASAGA
jgi:XTP/dITP diphosphohydrolase